MADIAHLLIEQVRSAHSSASPLRILGQGSKAFMGHACEGERLDVSGHEGVVAYDPSELVITVRAGTPLMDVQQVLAEQNQYLPFEPYAIDGSGTVGGMLASGWSGAGRPWLGAVRDYVLGTRLINGRGEALRLGGQVMKNVAGFDVSRLLCGSLGALGVITEVSFKVLPRPASVRTYAFDCSRQQFLAFAQSMAHKMSPITALVHRQERGLVRLAGEPAQLERFAQKHGLELAVDNYIWTQLQAWQHPVLLQREKLWRLSLPRFSLVADCPEALCDWAGAQYWLPDIAEQEALELAKQFGGHAYPCFRGARQAHPGLDPLSLRVHRQMKQAFDPKGLFNPGCLAEGV